MSVEDGTIAEPQDANDEIVDASSTTSNPRAGAQDPNYDEKDVPLVKLWLKRIRVSKHDAKNAFKRMQQNEFLAEHGATRDWFNGQNYTVAIVNRHINQAVAALYARDPVAQAKPRDKMRFTVWDGRQDTLQGALQSPMLPQSQAIIQDILKARQVEDLVKKTGRTLEILWKYFTSQQANGFKKEMKALVRRTKVDSVGYVKLAFQRVLEPRPEVAAQIEDATSELARTNLLLEQKKGDNWENDSAKAAELKYLLEQLKDKEYMVVREGPVFDFPRARHVIVDKECRRLKTLSGAKWIAQEFEFTDDEIMTIYGVDLKELGAVGTAEGPTEDQYGVEDAQISAYDALAKPKHEARKRRLVWEVQDKVNSQFLTVCQGYDQFLKKPAEPDVKIDRFFTIFPLVFNEIESEEDLYPPSDVELLQDTQMEYNRARQGLREHRQANRPKYVMPAGSLTDEDRAKLADHPANAVIELKALKIGDDVGKLLQRLALVPIDPNQYATQDFFSDIERIVGTQQANLGTGSNTTATETSIVEQGRQAGIGDNLDDLDELLSELALASSQLMLAEMSIDIVQKIAGPGAVWPDAPPSRQELSENVYLDIKAGSTGRPNKAVELSNIERALPIFLQVPGINLSVLRDRLALLLDMDPEELVAEGMPSPTAMNAMMVQAHQAAVQPPGAGGPPGAGVPGGPNGQQGSPGAGPAPNMQGHMGGQNQAPVHHMPTPGPRPGGPNMHPAPPPI